MYYRCALLSSLELVKPSFATCISYTNLTIIFLRYFSHGLNKVGISQLYLCLSILEFMHEYDKLKIEKNG